MKAKWRKAVAVMLVVSLTIGSWVAVRKLWRFERTYTIAGPTHVHGLAVLPGNHIDILLTERFPDAEVKARLTFAVERVLVISDEEIRGDDFFRSKLTLWVNADEAERLDRAQEKGTLQWSLRKQETAVPWWTVISYAFFGPPREPTIDEILGIKGPQGKVISAPVSPPSPRDF